MLEALFNIAMACPTYVCSDTFNENRYILRKHEMKINNYIMTYSVSDRPKQSEKQLSICSFCGRPLSRIEGTNIKVCTNKDCEHGRFVYKAM